MATICSTSMEGHWRRYVDGASRAELFRDMVLTDVEAVGSGAVLLDIGCGNGFDGELDAQRALAARAGRYIGVEPDPSCVSAVCSELHHCLFEDAPIEDASVDVAFSVFVQEHVADPARFWGKLWDVLRPGGVYWGFTADARHFFRAASTAMERLKIKDWYLDHLWGRRGVSRYNNYPTHYVANSPRAIRRYTERFSQRALRGFHRVGQMKNYFPASLRRLANGLDRLTILTGMPGSILVLRLQK